MAYYNFLGGEIPQAPSAPAKALVKVVRLYQKYVSPLKMGGTCRFVPVCSAYALEAVSRHGAVKGSLMAGARVCKCGPWHPGGYDPVPGSVEPAEPATS
ncbi:membrane protein insertion efficiency factor YidD [Corynebacterium sanguinis]|uniref:membrane protein insertion efficiency factor YidD n=1 Tax=Corynebacterium TaxID=1716 RepID=UPI001B875E4B|nr:MULTISPECIES: membrane protein insertion efficiency factor YidD [Corynebacterium]MCT1412757.1 membrane protein insertion efficiency factor YidD [Corynebacterium sanguinis]MCT1445207.1 membrane protein insertion efficiency factor YidD [Corynebacterium sanguinis]MCT1493214.1 membrane protein insertion efficiency factor YidD [Corynebacterium sanguinis]MCT1499940.1 membrane protein insertion efficiency factor YidD [Corynebacterium sanguinis]MCT1598342.1 membrane protein insertion efficiency fac